MSDARGRRDRHDIVAEILETARGRAIKTHIMCKAKLSYRQLEEYTTLLLEKGFLQKHVILKHERTQDIFETSAQGGRIPKKLQNARTLATLFTLSQGSAVLISSCEIRSQRRLLWNISHSSIGKLHGKRFARNWSITSVACNIFESQLSTPNSLKPKDDDRSSDSIWFVGEKFHP